MGMFQLKQFYYTTTEFDFEFGSHTEK